MKDIRIIPDTDGVVDFLVYGQAYDSALMLLQRLYVLMFSDGNSGYRGGESASALLAYLEGGNIPEPGVMNAAVAMACSSALDSLDDTDRELIESFSGECSSSGDSGYIEFTLVLADGTTITSAIENG